MTKIWVDFFWTVVSWVGQTFFQIGLKKYSINFLYELRCGLGPCLLSAANVDFSTVNSASIHCLRTHKYQILTIFSLKIGLIALFTHLQIILLRLCLVAVKRFPENTYFSEMLISGTGKCFHGFWLYFKKFFGKYFLVFGKEEGKHKFRKTQATT